MSQQNPLPTIAILGAGNLGRSIIAGLIKSGYPADKLWATAKHDPRLQKYKKDFHIHITTDNHHAAQFADVIIFAVKPTVLIDVVKEVQDIISKRKPLIISVAAGVQIESIARAALVDVPIIRAMPNTPTQLRLGAIGLCANAIVKEGDCNTAESIFDTIGVTCWVKQEELMDVVTALSGCGPAYFFLLMEALQQAAEEFGLPEEAARLLTLQTAVGAAQMALESEHSPSQLRQHVTSPGGTTEKALSVLEKHNFSALMKEALEAAIERAKEMANKY